MTTRIQLRRGTAAQWIDADPVLALGEAGIETDTQLWKVGDGTTIWTELPYMSADIASTYGNANVASFLASFGSNTVSTTGNISAGNFLTGGVVSAVGNVRGANFNTVGAVSATGNITGNYIFGNGSQLTGIGGGNTFSAITMSDTPSGASDQIKYGTGNLVSYLDGGWTIGEYNGTDYGTEGIRINPGIEGSADIVLPADPANVPVQVNNYSGNVQIQTGEGDQWTFDTNGSLNIPGSIVSASTITVDNRATGNSADINLYSADDITLQARDRTLGSGSEGGDINIYAGDSAEDGDSSGGDVQIYAGDGGAGNVDVGGSGGFIRIQGGRGGDASTSSGGGAQNGGDLTLRAGDSGSNLGNIDRGAGGGDVYIESGDSTANARNGGNIYLTTGAAGPEALGGSVEIAIPGGDLGPGGSWSFDGYGEINIPAESTSFGKGRIQSANGYPTLLAYGSGEEHGGPELDWMNTDNPNDFFGNSSVLRNTMYLNDNGLYIGMNENGVANVASPSWRFDPSGNLTLPGNTFAVNYSDGTPVNIGGGSGNTGNVTFSDQIIIGTGDSYGGGGLYLAPGNTEIGNLQYLRVRGGDYPTHIHFDTGNVQYYDQYFGDDNKYVKLEAGFAGNIIIGTDDDIDNRYTWTFDSAGNLTVPGNIKTVTTGFAFTSNVTNVDTTTIPGNVYITLANAPFGGPETGQVTISDVVGTTEANGTWYFEASEADQIQLFYSPNATNPVDGTGWPAYVSGGLAVAAGYSNLSITGGNVSVITNTGNAWTFTDNGSTIFPTLTVTRGDRTGTLTGQTILFGDSTQEAILTTPNGTSDINSSQRLVINPGAGYANTTGEGGDIYLYAGRGGDAGGSGGDIKIRGGLGPVNGDGGYIDITGGEADGNGVGGYIEMRGGQSASATGGVVRIEGGQGRNGAEANLIGGTGSAGSGGAVNIAGGTSSNGLAEYGNVNITSGASTWTFNNTGTLIVPGEGVVRSINDTIELQSYDTATTTAYKLRLGDNGGLYFEIGNNQPWLAFTNDSGDAEIGAAPGEAGTGNAGYNLTLFGGPADTSAYGTGAGGNIYLQAGLGGTNDGGGGGPGGWVNIIAGNSYDPAGVAGNVTISSSSNTWTFGNDGNLTTSSNLVIGPTGFGTGTGFTQSDSPLLLGSSEANGRASLVWFENPTGPGNIVQVGLNDSSTGSMTVTTGDFANTTYVWDFDNTGNLTAPGNIITSGSISAAGFTGAIQFRGADGLLSANADVTWDQGNLALYGHKLMCGNGGIGTSQSLLSIGNTNPTTIHMGGDATVILIGNAAGTTTFAGNITANGDITGARRVVTIPTALGNLTAIAGGRAFANDANLAAAGNFGAQVSGGAGNTVPVWSDGTNWYIG